MQHLQAKVNWSVYDDGNEAMNYFIKSGSDSNFSRPDLIVLDLDLPGKDGFSLLKYLKTDNQLKRIPVVVLTDSDSSKDIMDRHIIILLTVL